MQKHKLNIFPEMQPDDFERLKQDMDDNGYDINYPIWFYEGYVLDGWNRQRACFELGIEPVYAEFIGSMMDAIEFVMRSNKRRNLTSSQWACIAVEAMDIIEAISKEAKERMLLGRNQYSPGQLITQPSEDNKTASKVASMFNTNSTYIKEVKKLTPEVFRQVKSGEKTITEVKNKVVF